jgi:hypothetical protein
MRRTEDSALEEFKNAGWSVQRNGWPDYLLVRLRDDGKLEFMGLEVKSEGDNLSGVQLAMRALLISAGIPVATRKVKRSTNSV